MQSIFLWILIARRLLRDIYDSGGITTRAASELPASGNGDVAEAGRGDEAGAEGTEWKGDAELDAQVSGLLRGGVCGGVGCGRRGERDGENKKFFMQLP